MSESAAVSQALREQLQGLLRPAASRLVLDLSLVSHVDALGLAVLVGTDRRARLRARTYPGTMPSFSPSPSDA